MNHEERLSNIAKKATALTQALNDAEKLGYRVQAKIRRLDLSSKEGRCYSHQPEISIERVDFEAHFAAGEFDIFEYTP